MYPDLFIQSKHNVMKKILLIEDSDDVRNNTAEILELANYKVACAEDGKKGLEMALADTPDLIVCDVMMPVLDGYGVLHALHKNARTMNIPFIFLTAKTERSDLRKGMEIGADDYITKPFTGTELLNAVDGRLKKTESLKTEFASVSAKKTYSAKNAEMILAELTSDRNVNKYKKKQVIYSEGNRPARLFYILKGKVKIFKTNQDGKELVVELFNKGDFLGYAALLEETNYKETAEALEETELAVIPKDEFDDLITNSNEAARNFIRLLAKNVREKEEHLLVLAYNSLRKKVASALLLLDQKYNTGNEEMFSIDINRESLASIAGTATESMIRTLADFKSEKIIEMNHSNIIIRDRDKLKRMVG